LPSQEKKKGAESHVVTLQNIPRNLKGHERLILRIQERKKGEKIQKDLGGLISVSIEGRFDFAVHWEKKDPLPQKKGER